jgi:hypothetical protein
MHLQAAILCCYRNEAAQQDANAADSRTDSTVSDSSPEKKQKQNPKVSHLWQILI